VCSNVLEWNPTKVGLLFLVQEGTVANLSLSHTHKIQHSAFLSHSSGLQHGSSFSLQALLAQIFRQNKYHSTLETQASWELRRADKSATSLSLFFSVKEEEEERVENLRKDTQKNFSDLHQVFFRKKE
jgi:hypothetical protein